MDQLDKALRTVLDAYVGVKVTVTLQDERAKNRQDATRKVNGMVRATYLHGFLVEVRGGRVFAAYVDLYSGLVHLTGNGTLTREVEREVQHLRAENLRSKIEQEMAVKALQRQKRVLFPELLQTA